MNLTFFRKPLLATALVAGLSASTLGSASAAMSGLDFRLDNYRYDATLTSLRMSEAGADDYMTLHIGGPVEPRSYHQVTFSGNYDTCNYDLIGTLSNGDTVTWTDIDLCHTTDLTVH